MNPILLHPRDIAIAAGLVFFDAALSAGLHLGLTRPLLLAAVRMVVQLVLVGLLLRWVFSIASPVATMAVVLAMIATAAREVAARPERRLAKHGNLAVGAAAVATATGLTTTLALVTAIRPTPWYDPHYAIPLAGIVLGNVLTAASMALDGVLGDVVRDRAGIEARLALGASFSEATNPLLRRALRRALLPTINTFSAAGIITLPGIMTGQIIAGMDPLEAAKYQILLLFLLAGGSGLAAVATVLLARRRLTDNRERLRLDVLLPAALSR